MLKKMILLAVAAAVLPVIAAPVFELKFENGKANWAKVGNFLNRVKIEDKAFQGAKMATVVTAANPKAAVDTSFTLQTPLFDVTGKKLIRIEGEVYCTNDLKYTGGQGDRLSVVIPGKKNKLVPFTVSTPKKEFTPFSVTVPVTGEMKMVFVQLGYDNPNIAGENAFAVKSLKVSVE